jgi:protease IV
VDPQAEPSITPSTTGSGQNRQEKIVVFALLLFCLIAAVGNWVMGVRKPSSAQTEGNAGQEFAQSLLAEHVDLGVLAVDGTIMYQTEGGLRGGKGASGEKLVTAIRQAEKDGVKGLLIKINSPGGTAAASQAVYQQLQEIKTHSKVKIVAAMGDVAASGGYYIASAADMIVANPATLTGSIGVIAQFTKLQGLYDKLGLSTTVIKSGKHKDIGSPFRPTTPEETRILQEMIDDTYADFVKAVAQGRKMPEKRVRELADGRIYTGNQALKNKLVDRLGDYNFAMDQLKKMTQTGKDAKIKDYSKPSINELLDMFSTRLQRSPLDTLEEAGMAHLQHLNKVPLMLYY